MRAHCAAASWGLFLVWGIAHALAEEGRVPVPGHSVAASSGEWRLSPDTLIALLALTMSVVGWLVTYLLTVRAQRNQLRDEIMNRARLEISSAIKAYQDWLIGLDCALTGLRVEADVERRWQTTLGDHPRRDDDWARKISAFHDLVFSPVPRNWAGLLEEHEILFPETKKARVVLLERAYAIFSGLADCLNELRAFSSSAQALLTRRERALERAMTLMRALNPDQLALMHDLRVYLQNRCLGHITGNAVPPRRPTDPSLPVLWENADGELEVQRALPQHPVCEEDLVQKIVALESQLRDIAGHRRYDAHAVTEDVHQEELRLIAERAALLALLKYEDVERLSLIPRV